MTETIPGNDKLATLGDSGKPPKTRLSSAKEARELVEQFVSAGRERSHLDALYKGMFDGNPPKRRSNLIKNGQGWCSNVNPMEGKAKRSAACVPYYDLFAGSMYYCEPKTYYGDEDQQTDWNQVMTEEFDCLLRDYEEFDFNVHAMINDFVGYGKGFVMWPDDVTWQFEHIAQSRVKVRDRAKAALSKLDVLVILDELGVNEVWAFIENKKMAESAGWNVSTATQAIRDASPATLHNIGYDYDALQQQINDHDLSSQFSTPVVRIAHMYVREFSGDITHLIVARDKPKQKGSSVDQEEAFLFQKQDRYEKFSQAICPFFLEVLDGSWNGASGLGKDIYASIEIKTILFNKMVDNANIRASVLMQAKSASGMQKNQMVLGSGVTVIPPDFDVVPAHTFAEMESVMIADRAIDEKISNNTGIYRQTVDKPMGNPRTAEEVRLAYAAQAVLGNSAVNRFYKQLDRLYMQVFTRAAAVQPSGDDDAWEAARKFQKRCTDRGVPIKALRQIKSVTAVRTIGNGSHVMKEQAFDRLIPMSGGFPEVGRDNLWRDMIAAHTNQAGANRYFPKKAVSDLPNDHEALAVLENAAMKQGSPALVTSTQNHVIHATTHLRSDAQAIQTLQQGANPEEVLAYLHQSGPHIATHIQKLSQDPTRKQETKGLAQQWKQLAGFTDKLQKKVDGDRQAAQQKQQEAMAAAAKARAITNGADPETQILAAKTAAELKMKGEKHQQALAIKAQNAQQKGMAFRQDLAIKDATAAADIHAKNQEAARDAADANATP